VTDEKSSKIKSKPSRIGRNAQAGFNVRASIWVEKNGELYLGGGRVMLLENIHKLGSISAAARSMGLGYRNAWLWIKSMNQLASAPLVVKVKGGTGGGYAELTEEGHKAISLYKELRRKMESTLDGLSPE